MQCTLSYTTPLAYTVANPHRVVSGKTVMTEMTGKTGMTGDDTDDRNDQNDWNVPPHHVRVYKCMYVRVLY